MDLEPRRITSRPWLHTTGLAALLFTVTLIAHLGIIANPGFFSHDEWQKFDHVQDHGYANFAQAYGRVYAGNEFGVPVRPLGFLQQGISATWLERAPVVPHLFDVALHATIALLMLFALTSIGMPQMLAWFAALLFALSPLTTMATGWVAASFDQWYTLFVLIACWLTYRVMSAGLSAARTLGILIAASCAILSKETALILPGAMVLTAFAAYLQRRSDQPMRWRALAFVLALAAIPLAAYMAVRLPALANSMAGHATASYTPSPWNIPRNVAYYAAYPFLPNLAELGGIVFVNPAWIAAAILAHLALIVVLRRYAGSWYTLLYVASYYVFVAPVLSVQILGSHYLYGCAIPISIALGVLIWNASRRNETIVLTSSIIAAVVLSAHTLKTQSVLYGDGVCQSTFLSSLDTRMALEAERRTQRIVITPQTGARSYVGIRTIFARERYAGATGLPAVAFADPSKPEANASATVFVEMTPRCKVR